MSILIETNHIYVVMEGEALSVTLPEKMTGWHLIENANPHVSLMVNWGFETQDLGPLVKESRQI